LRNPFYSHQTVSSSRRVHSRLNAPFSVTSFPATINYSYSPFHLNKKPLSNLESGSKIKITYFITGLNLYPYIRLGPQCERNGDFLTECLRGSGRIAKTLSQLCTISGKTCLLASGRAAGRLKQVLGGFVLFKHSWNYISLSY
jgi:hypothetical protein